MTTPSDIRAALDKLGDREKRQSLGMLFGCVLLSEHEKTIRQALRFTLAAMEEPSTGMIVAAYNRPRSRHEKYGEMYSDIWKHMATALLEQVSNETLTTKENQNDV